MKGINLNEDSSQYRIKNSLNHEDICLEEFIRKLGKSCQRWFDASNKRHKFQRKLLHQK